MIPERADRQDLAGRAEEALAVKLQEACALLAEARSLHDLRRIEGFSRAVIEWARRQEELSLASRNEASFLWIEARAAQGEMLLRMQKAAAGRPKITSSVEAICSGCVTLKSLGYGDAEANRLQLLASVESERRRELLQQANAQGTRLTQKMLLNAAPARLTPPRSAEVDAPNSSPPVWAAEGLQGDVVTTGDARQLAACIPDESISLCICDPVYDRIEDYAWLATECERVLVPGGSVIAQCGNSRRYEAEVAMRGSGLTFVDLLAEVYPYAISRLFKAKVFVGWKPHLWFSKGPRSSGWIMNRLSVGGKATADPAKTIHPWADGETFVAGCIAKLCDPAGVVWDPFSGSGTVPVACRRLGISFVAFEHDVQMAARANERLTGEVTVDEAQSAFCFGDEDQLR